MEEIINDEGRTSIVRRVKEGLVWKSPRCGLSDRFLAEIDNAFAVEQELLKRLGVHPRIVRYYGLFRTDNNMKDGLLLQEANLGNLQSYMDSFDSHMHSDLRRKWCIQVAEALAYVHSKGIVHANLGTTNVLVHRADQTTNLILADFGGSKCRDLDLDGGLVPDDPFRDPQLTEFDSPKVDLFSLGILIYIITTGHYPFHPGPAPQNGERYTYGDRVQELFAKGEFPDLSGVPFAGVIAGCCRDRRFETAEEVVVALKEDMRRYTSWRPKVAAFTSRITVVDCVILLAWIIWAVAQT